jgi:hypothetical protein
VKRARRDAGPFLRRRQVGSPASRRFEGGNRDVTVRVFPGLNHLFLADPASTPDASTYAALPSKQVPAEVPGTLADWLVERLHAR